MPQVATETKTVFPCVHMNGTGKQALLDNLECVYYAVEKVRDALKQAAPNGRDYYIGTNKYKAAADQHMQRLALLDAFQKHIGAEMELISEQ